MESTQLEEEGNDEKVSTVSGTPVGSHRTHCERNRRVLRNSPCDGRRLQHPSGQGSPCGLSGGSLVRTGRTGTVQDCWPAGRTVSQLDCRPSAETLRHTSQQTVRVVNVLSGAKLKLVFFILDDAQTVFCDGRETRVRMTRVTGRRTREEIVRRAQQKWTDRRRGELEISRYGKGRLSVGHFAQKCSRCIFRDDRWFHV